MDGMVYWRIRQPDKKWRTWSSGLDADVDEAKVEAMHSVCDENDQLLDWAKEGVIVEMAELRQLDDWQITPDNHQSYRKNYLGLRDPEPEPEPDGYCHHCDKPNPTYYLPVGLGMAFCTPECAQEYIDSK